jgi:uncharacterized protein YjbJ (UPF0337 family)
MSRNMLPKSRLTGRSCRPDERIFDMSGNTDKAGGMTNEAAGKIKQGVGKAVGSDKLREKGLRKKQRATHSSLRGTRKTRSRPGLIK